MRFVPIKTDDQLDLQSLHRVRERWVMRRTAVINQIRGLLLERGITPRKGRCHLDAALPGILEDAATNLSGAVPRDKYHPKTPSPPTPTQPSAPVPRKAAP